MPGVERECITHHICDCHAARMAELEQEIARLRADLDTANERVHYWLRHFDQVNNDNGRLRLDLAAEREKREQAERERDEWRRRAEELERQTTFAERVAAESFVRHFEERIAEIARERDAAVAQVAQAREALRTLFDLLEEHGPPWYLNQHYKQAHAALDQARQGGDDA